MSKIFRYSLAAMVLVTLAFASSGKKKPAPAPGGPTPPSGKEVRKPSGLIYWEVKEGTGATAKTGDIVTVDYTGWLASDGKKFDSSVDRHQPFSFTLGFGKVIKGWDEGVQGMKVGGKRQLHIPPDLAYGPQGVG